MKRLKTGENWECILEKSLEKVLEKVLEKSLEMIEIKKTAVISKRFLKSGDTYPYVKDLCETFKQGGLLFREV